MGQKIIPISLRLNKRKNWETTWVSNKTNYAFLLHLFLELQKYFIYFFKNNYLEFINLKIKKKAKNIIIYIFLNKKIKKKNIYFFFFERQIEQIRNLLNFFYKEYNFKIIIYIENKIKKNIFSKKKKKKILKTIYFLIKKKNKKRNINKQIIYNLYWSFIYQNINFILFSIKKRLEKKKIHKKIIYNINNIFDVFYKQLPNIIGYKIQFKGRLNGYRRKKKIVYQKGNMPLNSLKYNIKYSFDEFQTPSGICSIKLWILFIK